MRYREYNRVDEVETCLYIEHPRKPGVYLPVHRRPMRLPDIDYASTDCVCFVTFNLHPACTNALTGEIAEAGWRLLWQAVQHVGCHVYAACMMPDHVHLLVRPSGKGETISDIVRLLKTWISNEIRKQFGVYLKWQPSFYDHVLRAHEKVSDEFEAIVQYIYDNPTKLGLGEDYPFRYRE